MLTRRNVLKTEIGLTAGPVRSAPGHNIRLLAGPGHARVVLTGLFPLGEFTGEHDLLYARVQLPDNGPQRDR